MDGSLTYHHDIITIGASAGGLEALSELVSGLPATLPAAVFIVVHIGAGSALAGILNRHTPLDVTTAVNGEPINFGHIYVAPPDEHLVVRHGHVHTIRGPKENHTRPSIDPLFRSAAAAYGPRVVGVILSGGLYDGTAGLDAIHRRGGTTIVQDPASALSPAMPENAIKNVAIDAVLPLVDIAPALIRLAHEPAPLGVMTDADSYDAMLDWEVRVALLEQEALEIGHQHGAPSAFSCPECGGVLWELNDTGLMRFRCHTGHAYTSESLNSQQSEQIDRLRGQLLREIQENIGLLDHIAQRAERRGDGTTAGYFKRQANEAEQSVLSIRQMLDGSRALV
jgi:two-component system, chemotaxis family, protein-glutamate methylesterase/glutaminase